jgi:DNA-directed RNA polymerase subunit RPC12/RpoP
MDESEDKIIVFESYDTVMTANLVKTKLDAYGIPCFLSDENFVGLYPIRNDLFTGVRLHIFEKDRARVKEIVGDQHDHEEEKISCPYCQSQRIVLKSSKKGFLQELYASLLSGLFLHPKNIYRCQECHREFDTPAKRVKSSTQ